MSKKNKRKRDSNSDYVEMRNISKDVKRKTKRGQKRRVSERLGGIKSLQDAEFLEDTEYLPEG